MDFVEYSSCKNNEKSKLNTCKIGKFTKYILLSTAIVFLSVPNVPVFAQETASPDSGEGSAGTIVVTGQRGGRPRTVAESPAPIDVIKGDQLAAPGRADLSESLSKLLPSINFGFNAGGVYSVVRPIFNRGLGPAYTLVLVNGKRRHNSALFTNGGGDTSGVNPVDLDALPLSSVAYIEVLKDSAAAQYGSDAVAGVINLKMKSQDHGGHISVMAGTLCSCDRNEGDLVTLKAEADIGFKLGDGGFVHVSGDLRKRGMAWNNYRATVLPFSPAANPKNAGFDGRAAQNGDPKIRSYSTSYNAELPTGDTTTLYSYGTFGQRWTVSGNSLRRPNSNANISQIFPNGFFPHSNTAETDYQALIGIKGQIGETRWDLSTTYGRNRVRQYSDRTINASLGPASPTRFDNLATFQFGQWVTNLDLTRGIEIGLPEPLQISAGVEYRVDYFQTFAGDPLGYANGGYIYRPGDQDGNPNVGRPAVATAQGGISLSPADETKLTRGNIAGYLDVSINPVKNWFVGGAVRIEHYDDAAGTTFGYKLNSRYDFTPWLALRGTVGTGFRAPSLTQIGYSQTDSRVQPNPVSGVVEPTYTKLARNDSALARALGAQDLKAEKSTNYGLGIVLRPAPRLNITLDGYQIKVKNRIVRTSPLFGPALANILTANNVPVTAQIIYFANGVDTRSRGFDLVADYSLNVGDGRLGFDAALNYNKIKITRIAAPPAALSNLGPNPGGSLAFLAVGTIGDMSTNLPKMKVVLGAHLSVGRFTINLNETRYGSYRWTRSPLIPNGIPHAARWLTDVDVSARLWKGLRVTAGASNLFGVHPQENGAPDPTTGSSLFLYGQPPFSQMGGFYYGKLSFDF
ncbi:TonB-dependent receptor domain-containing protein [Sphingobium subterraneum]|uniref:Iron complex outermembrane receptor protein n=1 Tax=Sphingobium subterraneum TaxID=627688 RepID=A0A841J9M6_9SPHN|nr:iron complex outermembrane receptor protein [Sphingobium subterraneum]